MSASTEAISRIDERTLAMAQDFANFKAELADMRKEIDCLQLAQARRDGQIDLLWKIMSLLGITGIVTAIKAFLT
jgi:hypothetical protein